MRALDADLTLGLFVCRSLRTLFDHTHIHSTHPPQAKVGRVPATLAPTRAEWWRDVAHLIGQQCQQRPVAAVRGTRAEPCVRPLHAADVHARSVAVRLSLGVAEPAPRSGGGTIQCPLNMAGGEALPGITDACSTGVAISPPVDSGTVHRDFAGGHVLRTVLELHGFRPEWVAEEYTAQGETATVLVQPPADSGSDPQEGLSVLDTENTTEALSWQRTSQLVAASPQHRPVLARLDARATLRMFSPAPVADVLVTPPCASFSSSLAKNRAATRIRRRWRVVGSC